MFTKYGYFNIGVNVTVCLIIAVAAFFIDIEMVKYLMFALSGSFLIFTLNFFRDPERVTPDKNNIVVSPADGTVILIKDVFEDRFIKEDCTQISIFMSPLNVHVNRIPLNGKVDYVNYVKGEYLVASHDKADERNERNEIGITGKTKVLFTQVAGYVARRIVSELKTEDNVKMGERFGMIKFGSRVDVIVPKSHKIMVNEGDKTKAGETILFEYDNE